MKERPILFSAPMVRAILAGTKTQTRRVAPVESLNIRDIGGECIAWSVQFSKPIRGTVSSYSGGKFSDAQARSIIASQFCPYGAPRDRLWVRETWRIDDFDDAETIYAADGDEEMMRETKGIIKWRSPIYMPRNRSRITLEITGVRVDRAQGISEADVWAEGWRAIADIPDENGGRCKYRSFGQFWESINGPGSWDRNPWVWVLEFRRVTP